LLPRCSIFFKSHPPPTTNTHFRSLRLSVRTSPFHGEKMGSIPVESNTFPSMTAIIILLPCIGVVTTLCFGRVLSGYSSTIAIALALCNGLLSLFVFSIVLAGKTIVFRFGLWSYSDLFEINWTFLLDSLSSSMYCVVSIVAAVVHLYSSGYMGEDPHLTRFIGYLSLFTLFMLLLISSSNFISLFLGWEGVGLCSYLLISFWYSRLQANKSALKAMIVNRISDVALTIGILAIMTTFQSIDYAIVFGLASAFVNTYVTFVLGDVPAILLICILLFLGAMGKSAQIGLHTWLPSAMEGPTPVSALIHAATMVTAGIFLVIRSSFLFEQEPSALIFVTYVGALTCFFSASAALVQNDAKKIIAYSTCSQLGFMTFACGLSSYTVSFFHLVNHAFFKALLFLSAGSVIHALSGEQDARRLGGLAKMIPYTFIMIVMGSIALMGFPFLSGYYSKDLILEIGSSYFETHGAFAYWIGLFTACCTAFYSLRLIYLAFLSPMNGPKIYVEHTHELAGRMALALIPLAIGTAFSGYALKDMFIGAGSSFWNGVIFLNPHSQAAQIEGEFLPTLQKMFPLFGTIGATLAVFLSYHLLLPRWNAIVQTENMWTTTPANEETTNQFPSSSSLFVEIYRFLSHTWYFDTVYNRWVNKPILEFAYNSPFVQIDKLMLEWFGPGGLSTLSTKLGRKIHKLQTGVVQDYAAIWLMIASLVICFFTF
jgi:proton-translocating NADH-quinone oxidoreductase chain L